MDSSAWTTRIWANLFAQSFRFRWGQRFRWGKVQVKSGRKLCKLQRQFGLVFRSVFCRRGGLSSVVIQ